MNILITGAGSGIGRSLAEELVARGNSVVGLSRRRHKRGSQGQLLMIACDVRRESDVNRAVKKAVTTAGPIDVVVHSAGVTVFKKFLRTSSREFERVVQTNLLGTMFVTKAVLPEMVRRRRGLIVNIASYAVKTVYTGSSAYSASKAGTVAMMNSLREEIRNRRVRVMNVYPGAVRTPMWPVSLQRKHGTVMMEPKEIAKIVCDAIMQPPHLTVEELVIRPAIGDLRV